MRGAQEIRSIADGSRLSGPHQKRADPLGKCWEFFVAQKFVAIPSSYGSRSQPCAGLDHADGPRCPIYVVLNVPISKQKERDTSKSALEDRRRSKETGKGEFAPKWAR